MYTQFFFWGLLRIRKTQVNDSTKINAILNIKLDNIIENSKGTGTHKKISFANWQVNNSTLKNVHTFIFFVSLADSQNPSQRFNEDLRYTQSKAG